jgi:hypothetical protein
MTQDPSDPSAELARLLRAIDELGGPQQPRLPGAPALETFDVNKIGPLRDPNEPGKALITQSDQASQPQRREVEVASKSRKPFGAIAIVVVASAVVAVIFVLKMPSISIVVAPGGEPKFQIQTRARTSPDADVGSIATNPNGAETTAVVSPSAPPIAIDLVPVKPARPGLAAPSEKISLQRDQAWPLGGNITVDGRGGTLLVRGLAAGTTLSVGQPSDVDGWELDVGELGGAAVIPPRGFLGAMDLTVALRRNGATSDQQGVQVEWAGATAPAPVRLEPGDVARLMRRGEELLANQDIAAARAVFERLADNGEPRGALALAETYEQSTLARLGVRGLAPDPAAARTWYERAKALGSTEAQHRLDLLASRGQ